eukprot:2463653-Amphidinium_carterae.1
MYTVVSPSVSSYLGRDLQTLFFNLAFQNGFENPTAWFSKVVQDLPAAFFMSTHVSPFNGEFVVGLR